MKRIMPREKCSTCFLLLLLILGLHGCAGTYSVVEFEVLEPANVSFPDQVNRLLVLTRAPVTLDSFNEEDREGFGRRELLIVDSLIINSIKRGLTDALKNSPVKRFHDPEFIAQRRKDTLFTRDLILTKREVNALCERTSTDAIVSLEKYSLRMEQQYDYYDDGEGVALVRNHFYIFSNRIQWTIYLPGNPRPFDEYSTVDTLYFPRVEDGVFTGAPSSAEMLRELFYESGLRYGSYLVPVWVRAYRTVYTGKEDALRKASRHTREGEWDIAYALWEQTATSADSTLAAKSLYNMAIYHELEDDLDSASLLIDRSLQYDSLELLHDYREELDVRLENRKEVIEQVIN